MKKLFVILLAALIGSQAFGQEKTIQLADPDLTKGKAVMEALSERKSTREYQNKALSKEDLSNLLWAAVGVNRPDGKRTAPTARNQQEITVYAILPEGAYKYEADKHILTLVTEGDHRQAVAAKQDFVKTAPVCLVVVADTHKFDEGSRHYAYVDAGIVSQNINVFCAGAGLATVTRSWMEADKLIEVLKLKEGQIPVVNNPVGYPVKK